MQIFLTAKASAACLQYGSQVHVISGKSEVKDILNIGLMLDSTWIVNVYFI